MAWTRAMSSAVAPIDACARKRDASAREMLGGGGGGGSGEGAGLPLPPPQAASRLDASPLRMAVVRAEKLTVVAAAGAPGLGAGRVGKGAALGASHAAAKPGSSRPIGLIP